MGLIDIHFCRAVCFRLLRTRCLKLYRFYVQCQHCHFMELQISRDILASLCGNPNFSDGGLLVPLYSGHLATLCYPDSPIHVRWLLHKMCAEITPHGRHNVQSCPADIWYREAPDFMAVAGVHLSLC